VTHTYIQAIKKPTLHYLTRSVRRRAASFKSPVHSVGALVPLVRWVTLFCMSAASTSWERTPFKECVPIPYRAAFDAEQFVRLKAGLIPQTMEDKWFIHYEEPELFFHRSWTGQPVYRLTLATLADGGAAVSEALWSKELAVASKDGPDYQVQLLDFLVANLLLGQSKPFPLPSDCGSRCLVFSNTTSLAQVFQNRGPSRKSPGGGSGSS
jgi:hypothetical protein